MLNYFQKPKEYLKILEEVSSETQNKLPRGYERIKGTQEKIDFLETRIHNSIKKSLENKI